MSYRTPDPVCRGTRAIYQLTTLHLRSSRLQRSLCRNLHLALLLLGLVGRNLRPCAARRALEHLNRVIKRLVQVHKRHLSRLESLAADLLPDRIVERVVQRIMPLHADANIPRHNRRLERARKLKLVQEKAHGRLDVLDLCCDGEGVLVAHLRGVDQDVLCAEESGSAHVEGAVEDVVVGYGLGNGPGVDRAFDPAAFEGVLLDCGDDGRGAPAGAPACGGYGIDVAYGGRGAIGGGAPGHWRGSRNWCRVEDGECGGHDEMACMVLL
jgi:hypothetical protein